MDVLCFVFSRVLFGFFYKGERKKIKIKSLSESGRWVFEIGMCFVLGYVRFLDSERTNEVFVR